MDYKSTLIKIFVSLFCLSAIVGCDTEISPEPLRITGFPPSEMYYGSLYEFEFGAAGGDGVYRYRYIKNPDNLDDDDAFAENTVDMSIQVKDGAKPSFTLLALPKLPEGVDIASINDQKLRYALEITDGKNTKEFPFEFTLKKNRLTIENVELNTEGRVVNNAAKTLLNRKIAGDEKVCEEITKSSFEKNEADGQSIYPFVFRIQTEAVVAAKTEFYYRLKTDYTETIPEKAVSNFGYLRTDVDYQDAVRKIVLDPGNDTCVGFINFFDDTRIEGNEKLTIEFFDAVGGDVDVSTAKEFVELRDNEPTVIYTTKEIVRNRGESIVVPVKINRTVDYPVSLNFSIDENGTTAKPSDYLIEPQGQVITFAPNETESSYTVNLLNNTISETDEVSGDKVVSIITEIDELVEVDPFKIEINDWATTSNTQEIISVSNNDEQVVDFIVDGEGVISTIIQSNTPTNISTLLRSFERDSSSFNFSSSGDLELSKVGVDVIPKAIEVFTTPTTHRAVIVMNVNGLYADIYRGGMDFVVMIFERISGESFTLVSAKQYGTEGDDIVKGSYLKGSTLYVYGNTNGQNFEGAPSSDTNFGGEDGMLYAIDVSNNIYQWARFIGTSDNDSTVSVDVSNRDIATLNSTFNTDVDAFTKVLNQNGLDENDSATVSFSSVRDETPVSVLFDSSGSNFSVLIDSNANIDSENETTPSLSRDAQLKTINASSESVGYVSFATSKDEKAKALLKTSDNLHLVVAGDTFGRFEDNVKAGTDNSDIFVSFIDSESFPALEVKKILQYGTTENDRLIKVRMVSNTKFFALWGEEFSSTGNTTYRISAFSIDGEKLSSDPQ